LLFLGMRGGSVPFEGLEEDFVLGGGHDGVGGEVGVVVMGCGCG
jgi:hypothetical protein